MLMLQICILLNQVIDIVDFYGSLIRLAICDVYFLFFIAYFMKKIVIRNFIIQ